MVSGGGLLRLLLLAVHVLIWRRQGQCCLFAVALKTNRVACWSFFLIGHTRRASMTLLQPGTLGIDFGTSNSAMAWADGQGLARLIPLEGAAVSMPTRSEERRGG